MAITKNSLIKFLVSLAVFTAIFTGFLLWKVNYIYNGNLNYMKHSVDIFEKKIDLTDIYYVNYLGGEAKGFKNSENTHTLLMTWASWCGNCKAEMPEVENIYNLTKGTKLQVVAIAEPRDTPYKIETFRQSATIVSMPLYMNPSPNLFKSLRIKKVPSFFLIDPQGFAYAELRPIWDESIGYLITQD